MSDSSTSPLNIDGSSKSNTRKVLTLVAAVASLVVVWLVVFSDTANRPDLTVSWDENSVRVSEGVEVVEITARLSAPAPEDLVVGLEFRGTATPGEDYSLAAAGLGFAQGDQQAVLSVRIVNDGPTGEDRETIMIQLVTSNAVRVVRRDTVSVVIEDPRSGRPPTTRHSSTSTTATTISTQVTGPMGIPSLDDMGVGLLADGASSQVGTVDVGPLIARPSTLMILIVASASSSAPTPIPIVSDSDLTWELVETSTRDNGPRRISMFRAVTGEAGAIQSKIDFGRDEEVIDWILFQVQDALTGENGGDAVLQTGVAAAVDFEFNAAVPLQALMEQDSITIGGFFIGANRAEGVEGFATISTVGPTKRLLLAIAGRNPVVATKDWPTRAHWIGVAAEIDNSR